jgi:magnesium-transporting ATPase (P-type)
MIFQTEYWTYIQGFFDWVAQSAGVMVFITGFVAFTWLGFERKRRGSFTRRKAEEKGGFDFPKFLRIMSYFGIIIGILDIWAGSLGLIRNIPPSFRYADLTGTNADHFTCIFLIVIGIAMIFKPINDLPLSSIIGGTAGAATVLALIFLVPDSAVDIIAYWINPKLALIIIFIVVTAIVAMTAKFYVGVLQAISKFLSWPPVALIVMIFAFLQGILLWGLGTSIFVNFL